MAATRRSYRCRECATPAARWVGRCGGCGGWDTLEEVAARPSGGRARSWAPAAADPHTAPPVRLVSVDAAAEVARPTGVAELDRVLGGGLVPGSVTLLGGEPGIGKSTLVLQVARAVAATGTRCLLVSGEESTAQVRARAGRLGPVPEALFVQAETSLPAVLGAIDAVEPELCLVDSVQTLWDPDLGSAPGSVLQVRDGAHALARVAKERAMSCVLVGHVTKDGGLAGPRVLEHLVDTVLSLEGDRHLSLRMLRAAKHRFGATGELGLFEMGDAGLDTLAEPARLLLGDRREAAPGSIVLAALDGRRPLVVEVQGLVVRSELATPRRSAQGVDSGRLSLLLAVLDRRASVSMGTCDVFASVVGGFRIAEPAGDLAIAMALASSWAGVAVPADVVAVGEVGLAGELRQVHQMPARLREAARLGFRRAIVPASTDDPPEGLDLLRASSLGDAVLWLERFAHERAAPPAPRLPGLLASPGLEAMPG